MASKTSRFTRSDGTHLPAGIAGNESLDEFNRLENYAKAFSAPQVKYKDLEAIVTSRMVRDQIHFLSRTDFLKVTSDTDLVPITVQVPNRELTFKAKDGVHSAELDVFGRVTTLTGRVVQTFEDSVAKDYPDSLFALADKQMSIYQKSLPLRPGLYRLDLVIKDVNSGNVGAENQRLAVPRYGDDQLESSSLVLADQIEHVPPKQIGTGQFVFGSLKVRPRLDGEFASSEKLGIYIQIYNLRPDDGTHKSRATFVYTVKKADQQVMQFKETSLEIKQTGDQATIGRLLPLGTLTPGQYSLELLVIDALSGKTLSKSVHFTIKPPADIKADAKSASESQRAPSTLSSTPSPNP